MVIPLHFSKFMLASLLASSCAMTFSMEPLEPALRECGICLDDKPEPEFTALTCGHQTICNVCRQERVISALQRNTAAEMREALRCTSQNPNPANPLLPIRCNHIINEIEIRSITNNEASVTQYSEKLFQELLNTDRSIKRCPTQGCTDAYSLPEFSIRGLISEGIVGTPAIQCRSCNQEYCPHCQMTHSRYALCPDAPIANNQINNNNNAENNGDAPADILERQARAVMNWMSENNAKECPSCHGLIEKNDGCRHMTHKPENGGCGYEFCWDCLIPWPEHDHNYPYTCTQADLIRAGAPVSVSVINQCIDGARYVLNTRFIRHIRDRRVIFVLLVCTVSGSVGYKIIEYLNKK